MTKVATRSEDLERRLALEQVQPLLTKARTALRRLEFQTARELCVAALERVPDCAYALELKGDVHRALGEHDAALDAYRKAAELEPGNRRVENKYAMAAIARDETRLLEERREAALADPDRFLKGQKNPLVSFLASCVFPGIGQLYNEEFLKGGIVLVVFLFSSYYTVSAMGMMMEPMKVGRFDLALARKAFEAMTLGQLLWYLFNTLLTGLAWTYSVIEAPLTTVRENKRRLAELAMDEQMK